MARGTLTLAERRSALVAAREALTGLGEVLATASGRELGELMGLADEVAARGVGGAGVGGGGGGPAG